MPKKSYSKEAQQTFANLSAEDQGVLQAVAQLRVENRVMSQNFAQLRQAYDSLYAVMITLLHTQPDRELRIHKSQFLRFKKEYRIDQKAEGEEIVLRLLTVTDKISD